MRKYYYLDKDNRICKSELAPVNKRYSVESFDEEFFFDTIEEFEILATSSPWHRREWKMQSKIKDDIKFNRSFRYTIEKQNGIDYVGYNRMLRGYNFLGMIEKDFGDIHIEELRKRFLLISVDIYFEIFKEFIKNYIIFKEENK